MKTFYVVACCVLVAAIAADFCSKRCYSIAARAVATAVPEIGHDRTAQASAKEKSTAALRAGRRCAAVGLILAGIGLASWLQLMLKGDHSKPAIPATLLFAYIVLSLMMV
jgi:hypothetical protein